MPENATEGDCHDLADILDAAFRSSPILGLAEGRVSIRWRGSRAIVRREQVNLASFAVYKSRSKIIHVNRILDQDWVPAFYIRHVVSHEILHYLIPWTMSERHTPQFIRAEKSLPGYKRAVAWHNANINKLLGQNGPNPV